jgi:trk system potassium uptake protein TrkA
MHVIVVGCGRVGSELADRLVRDGHSTVIVDKRTESFRRLPEGWAGRSIAGTGIDRDVLEEAGVRDADALAAVTSGDNTNILVARIARENFEVPRVVARIYDPRRAVIYQRLGIPTVGTVSWTVDQVTRRLLPEMTASAWTDPSGEVSLVERMLPDGYAGHRLGELTSEDDFRPILVTRAGEARLPISTTVGQEGDVVLFAVHSRAFEAFERRLAEGDPAAGQPPAGRDGTRTAGLHGGRP